MDVDDLVIIASRNTLTPIWHKSISIIALLTWDFSFESLIRKFSTRYSYLDFQLLVDEFIPSGKIFVDFTPTSGIFFFYFRYLQLGKKSLKNTGFSRSYVPHYIVNLLPLPPEI